LVAASVVLGGTQYYHHLPMELLVQLLDIDILLVEGGLAEVHLQHLPARRLLILVSWAALAA